MSITRTDVRHGICPTCHRRRYYVVVTGQCAGEPVGGYCDRAKAKAAGKPTPRAETPPAPPVGNGYWSGAPHRSGKRRPYRGRR